MQSTSAWAMPTLSAAKQLGPPATIDYADLEALGNQGNLLQLRKHNVDPLAVENRKHNDRLILFGHRSRQNKGDEALFLHAWWALQHLSKY